MPLPGNRSTWKVGDLDVGGLTSEVSSEIEQEHYIRTGTRELINVLNNLTTSPAATSTDESSDSEMYR